MNERSEIILYSIIKLNKM